MSLVTQGKINLAYILIIVFLAVIIGGGALIWQYLSMQKEVMEEKAPVIEGGKEPATGEEEDISKIVLEDPEAEIAPLLAVDGSNSSGAAYKLFKGGKLHHIVMATMPDPQEGNVYEGWLVQPDPLEFFSTGIMKINEDGFWVLEYTADNEYPTYTKVVITEETLVDSVPEVNIIEGSF